MAAMYRDEQTASAERIDALEDALVAKDERIDELTRVLAERDDRLDRVADRASLRQRHLVQRWRLVAAVLFVLCVALGWLLARPLPVATAATEPAPTLADPTEADSVPEPPSFHESPPAPTGDSPYRFDPEGPRHTLRTDDPFDESRYAPADPILERELRRKLRDGTATQAELRLLMSICSRARDLPCRNQAFAAWKANKP